MNDPGKYVKLFWILLLSFASFIIVFVLLFIAVRLLMGVVNALPWITYIYTLFVLSVPAGIFISAFTIFISRTRAHVSAPVRIASYAVLGIFLCSWIVFYILDIISFIRTSNTLVLDFKCWDLIFLSSSVAGLFIIGVIQALGAPKEKDWMERGEHSP